MNQSHVSRHVRFKPLHNLCVFIFKYLKKCSASLVFRKKPTKTALRHHASPSQNGYHPDTQQMSERMWKNSLGSLLIQVQSADQYSQIELPYGPAIRHLGIHQSILHPTRETFAHPVYCCSVHDSKDMEPARMSINQRSIQRWYGLLFSYKENKTITFAEKWMDLEIILSKVVHTQK